MLEDTSKLLDMALTHEEKVMSEEKFTQGEWEIWGDWAIKCGDKDIGSFESIDKESLGVCSEGMANANLMKESKNMYLLLKDLHGMFDQKSSVAVEIEHRLAKARGDEITS